MNRRRKQRFKRTTQALSLSLLHSSLNLCCLFFFVFHPSNFFSSLFSPRFFPPSSNTLIQHFPHSFLHTHTLSLLLSYSYILALFFYDSFRMPSFLSLLVSLDRNQLDMRCQKRRKRTNQLTSLNTCLSFSLCLVLSFERCFLSLLGSIVREMLSLFAWFYRSRDAAWYGQAITKFLLLLDPPSFLV